MAKIQHLRVVGSTELYDVVRDGETLGIVWQIAGVWYADQYSMTAPEIRGGSRDEVTAKLDLARSSRQSS